MVSRLWLLEVVGVRVEGGWWVVRGGGAVGVVIVSVDSGEGVVMGLLHNNHYGTACITHHYQNAPPTPPPPPHICIYMYIYIYTHIYIYV